MCVSVAHRHNHCSMLPPCGAACCRSTLDTASFDTWSRRAAEDQAEGENGWDIWEVSFDRSARHSVTQEWCHASLRSQSLSQHDPHFRMQVGNIRSSDFVFSSTKKWSSGFFFCLFYFAAKCHYAFLINFQWAPFNLAAVVMLSCCPNVHWGTRLSGHVTLRLLITSFSKFARAKTRQLAHNYSGEDRELSEQLV